jgi:hypothetical protein
MNAGRRAKLGALLLISLLLPARGAPSKEQDDHGAPPPEAAQLDPQTAGVARRLWGDLVCLCDRCERLTLAACHCPDAARERKHILELLRARDLSPPGSDEVAYQAVVSDYVTRKGREALASARSSRAPSDWPALAVSIGVIALGCGAVAVIEHRRRRARRSGRGSRR